MVVEAPASFHCKCDVFFEKLVCASVHASDNKNQNRRVSMFSHTCRRFYHNQHVDSNTYSLRFVRFRGFCRNFSRRAKMASCAFRGTGLNQKLRERRLRVAAVKVGGFAVALSNCCFVAR